VALANLNDRDIAYQMSKLREWLIDLQWSIPEQRWGIKMEIRDEKGRVVWIGDFNLLKTTLEQMFYLQLTRAKGGMTLKELNTSRFVSSIRGEQEAKKPRWF